MLPTKIKIFHEMYTVLYFEKAADIDPEGKEQLWGRVDFWTASIRLYNGPSYSPDSLKQTMLHEILHILYEKLHIDKGEEEEHFVDLVATGLLSVLKDNPGLVSFLGENK